MESSPTEVPSTEDVVKALLEYLVDPILPLKSSTFETPSISQQQSVARQVHAAVLLYNYYQRKHHPELEFLGFESFCKLAVILKPSLMVHMKFMHRADHSKFDDLENQLSLTERAIMDACTVSRTLLDALQDVSSSLKEWPISKVAVLLIDSMKENCMLLFSSVTKGVWSVIEKDFDSESMMVGRKRKTIDEIESSLMVEQDTDDEAGLQRLAFSAVKETTGMNGAELKVLERHVVYSLSKEKTAACFYIVQCTQSISEDLQASIKDAFDSLQGPVVKKSSGSWIITPVVKHFQLLPYAGIVSDWFSRELLLNSLQDQGNVNVNISHSSEKPCEKELGESKEVFSNTLHDLKSGFGSVNVNSPRTKNPCDNEFIENRDKSNKSCTTLGKETRGVNISEMTENPCDNEVMETINSSGKEATGTNSEFPKQKGSNGSRMIGLYNSSSGPHSMDVDGNQEVHLEKEDENKCSPIAIKVYHHQKKGTSSAESYIFASTDCIKVKAEVAELKTKSSISQCRDEKVDTEKKSRIIPPDPEGMPTVDIALVPFQPNANYLEKMQLTMATKGTVLSQTALRVLIRKRDKLSNQLRNLEDEMALCERNIQAILDGDENALSLKLEAIIDCCNDACLEDEIQSPDRTNQHVADKGLSKSVNDARLPEAILTLRTPCQELDNICRANNWMLPVYRVSPSDGGFLANVTVKGLDFECTGGSDLLQSPGEARDSAAVQMLAKLCSMAGQAQ